MTATSLNATVTAHKGYLVFELKAKSSIPNEVASSIDNPGNLGQVIMNTAQKLGVSAQALALLGTVPVGRDSLGDVDWFRSADMDVFGWLGGPFTLKLPSECETARGFALRAHVVIANEPAEGAVEAIEELLANPED